MKGISIKSIKPLVYAIILTATFGAASTATAASQCKGLENAACESNSACGWVASYERKDGRKVRAFCRTKANSKAKSKATSLNESKPASSVQSGS